MIAAFFYTEFYTTGTPLTTVEKSKARQIPPIKGGEGGCSFTALFKPTRQNFVKQSTEQQL